MNQPVIYEIIFDIYFTKNQLTEDGQDIRKSLSEDRLTGRNKWSYLKVD